MNRQFGSSELDFVGDVQEGGISVDSSGVYVVEDTSGISLIKQAKEV